MLQQAPRTGTSPDASVLTLADYLDQWLSHSKGRVRAKTHDGYRGLIRLYAAPALGRVPLEELRPLDLQGLYGRCLERGLSGGTVLNLHLVLTQALHQAVRWGLISSNPAQGAQPPRPRRPERVVVDPVLATRILAAVRSTTWSLRWPRPSPPGCAGGRSWPFGGPTSIRGSPWPTSEGPCRPPGASSCSRSPRPGGRAGRWTFRGSSHPTWPARSSSARTNPPPTSSASARPVEADRYTRSGPLAQPG